MLDDRFDPAHFRGQIEEFYAGAPGGWPSWAFSNHDVLRHVTRWEKYGIGREPLAKLAGALLLSLEGSICIYQGDELGQTETDLEYFELTDPQGLRFWPENKGRDGCRTPMVWDSGNASSGFSTGRPWLPIKAPQAANHVAGQAGQPDSVLEFYRAMLKLRRETEELRSGRSAFFDVSDPILAFTRGGTVLCVFNLSPEEHRLRLTGGGAVALAQGAEHAGDTLTLHPNGFAIMEVAAETFVADVPPLPGRRRPDLRLAAPGPRAPQARPGCQRLTGTPFSSNRCRFSSNGRMPMVAPQGIEVLPSWRTSTGSPPCPMSTKR